MGKDCTWFYVTCLVANFLPALPSQPTVTEGLMVSDMEDEGKRGCTLKLLLPTSKNLTLVEDGLPDLPACTEHGM
jgi:hypothetical protein